ncbi:DNA repair protein RadA [Candidatus Omnitrophota bacterium]
MKTKTIFVCQGCGAQSPKWQGRCSNCGNWNSLTEEVSSLSTSPREQVRASSEPPVLLSQVDIREESRVSTGITELDRVLGGGIVGGSVILVGGDPGIGKSTLSLQASAQLSQAGFKVLYVSGEESVKQTKLRASRLQSSGSDSFYIVNEINLDVIVEYIKKLTPDFVIIDSIQVLYHPELSSSPGSVSQVKECAGVLTQLAKSHNIALFLVGHVTKEGSFAGPKVLEHIVDTVMYFEGERCFTHRILRTTKNRFGSTNEIGVFEMSSAGLLEVKNPSEIFLSERPQHVSGSVVIPVLEGTRPILVEVQALVSKTSYGLPRRRCQGMDFNRLTLLVAVLEKKIGLGLWDKDVFVNVAGGVTLEDPAADLGVVVAIASAMQNKAVSGELAVLGEVGLAAEVRSISQVAIRINEAQKLGFKRCIVPKNNLKAKDFIKGTTIKIVPVMSVKEALEFL